MKKNIRLIILIIGAVLIFWGGYVFIRYRIKVKEHQRLQEYAEKVCIGFETKDISVFDELCDDETVFLEQNTIYGNLREEFAENLENGMYEMTEYHVDDFNANGIQTFSIFLKWNESEDIIKVEGMITLKKGKSKYYIDHFSLWDNRATHPENELVGRFRPDLY